MSASDPTAPGRPPGPAEPRRAVLLTSYKTGAHRGRNLGRPGYSYDIVAELFAPLLGRWGEVVRVGRALPEVEAAARDARHRGLEPVHVSFLPFQDAPLAPSVANVVVPAWEFPDVPDHAFDGNPQNDWVATSARCTLVIVGGPYTADAFRRAGIRTPTHVVPVPTPADYFAVPAWDGGIPALVGCDAYVFPHPDAARAAADSTPAPGRRSLRASLHARMREAYRRYGRPLVAPAVHDALRAAAHALAPRLMDPFGRAHRRPYLELSGVVYTSIFNPGDGRKNWEDLLGGFLTALGDRDDATLVLKLITTNPVALERVAWYYRTLDRRHRCRVVFLTGYLSAEQMLALARASTYYVTTTRAEGNCLPVMNYLAAGRPVLSPCHTAISDYFGPDLGFVLQTHPEPAVWPHDGRLRYKTTWGRLVWPSLLEQLKRSYQVARHERAAYDALAERGRQKMRGWAHPEAVWARLRAALDAVEALPAPATQAA
jgi:glycosyltransferase involved in cell wall biosynthesis